MRSARIARVLALPAAGLLLAATACTPAVLSPAGPVGAADRTILIDSLAIMLCIVVPTICATLLFAWWFRSGNARARFRPDFVYSGRIELVVWSVPLMTIMLLGGVTWIGAHELDPATPLPSKVPAIEIQGVSLDWKWLFIYPGQRIAAVNQLVIPAGVPVRFTLTSASVMNTFFVPQLGSMIYTMNGMSSHLNLSADAPGLFRGMSAHYSGDGFSDMHFEVRAITPDQFSAWVSATRGTGPVLSQASYAGLEKQSMHVTPFTFRDADPTLFDAIVSQKIPPAAGPAESGASNAGISLGAKQ